MRWISDEKEFHEIFLEARTCVFIDSGRYNTALTRLTFDEGHLLTNKFGNLLKDLMQETNESFSYFTVLEPEPKHYYHQHFGIYPCIEFDLDDFPDSFRKPLNQPHGNCPGNDLGSSYFEFTLAPRSLSWFFHAFRSNDDIGGHFWVPAQFRSKIAREHLIFHEEP